MSSLATDTANDASRVVLLLRAVVLPVADLATILAGLVLVVSEGTVKSGKFAKLVALQLVLAFRNRSSLNKSVICQLGRSRDTNRFDDVVNQLLRLVDLFLSVRHDQTVQVFLLVAGMGCVRSAFAFLDGTLATDSNFCSGLGFHLFECISTGANEKANC